MVEAERQRNPRCASACRYCRVKKVKCNGGRPCGNCIDHNEDCAYPDSQRGNRKRKSKTEMLEERFSRIESFLNASKMPRLSESAPSAIPDLDPLVTYRATPTLAYDAAPCAPIPSPPAVQLDGRNTNSMPARLTQTSPPDNNNTVIHPNENSYTGSAHIISPLNSMSMQPQHLDQRDNRNSASCSPLDVVTSRSEPPPTLVSPPAAQNLDRRACETQDHNVNDIEGNTSYLAICAGPALDWMSRRVGVPDFTAVARELTSEIWGHRRYEAVQPERMPEPDFETAWSWSRAHFDRAHDKVFGGIDRQAFESRLIAQFESQNIVSTDDCAWYALRNTVYASGCRITMAKAPLTATFVRARQEAYRYFENALSVHTELIYARSSIAAVQALMSMAYFSEGTGDLAVEYMLLSNAIRLAQSKDLHLRAMVSATLTEKDVATRHALWWNLYIHDKHLALRSGRPSVINDGDITSPIPDTQVPGHQTNMEFYRIMIKHSQITSLILKRLSPRKTRTKSADRILQTVRSLDKELRDWHACLPSYYRNGYPFVETELPEGISQFHINFVNLIYNSCLIVLHTIFCYPWIRLALEKEPSPEILAQRQKSMDVVASAARDIIITIQGADMTVGAGISSIAVYFPIVGLYNLFLHVLQQPTLPTVNSDLALMDTVVGHYGYLEYISGSEFSTQFPRKVVSYAREIVKRLREPSTAHDVYEGMGSVTESSGINLDPDLHEFILGNWDVLGYEDWSFSLPGSGMPAHVQR